MPHFAVQQVASSTELHAIRCNCDGCDPARPAHEQVRDARLWILTAGAFELRDRDGRHAIDPSRAALLPAGHAFAIRHPAGPDTCIGLRGPLVDALARDRTALALLPVAPALVARIATEIARLRRGDGDTLALAEAVAAIDTGEPPTSSAGNRTATRLGRSGAGIRDHVAVLDIPPDARLSRRDRDLAAALAHAIRISAADATTLAELAREAGASVFHACRVFRRATGYTIHGFRHELRLRRALALLADTDTALADIALATGFASQSHLTHRFRDRYGVTPGRARQLLARQAPA